MVTIEWPGCFICATLKRQSDCQAGLTVIKDLANLCASGGWAFCSELRNVTDDQEFEFMHDQRLTFPHFKIICESRPKRLNEKSHLAQMIPGNHLSLCGRKESEVGIHPQYIFLQEETHINHSSCHMKSM